MRLARELSGCDVIMCIMSGNFVQRAEAAIVDKYTRAAWAVKHGADIVIELPTIFAVSTADNFARGAIKMLSQIKEVTHLSFGCESDKPSDLFAVAEILAHNDFEPYFRRHIKKGVSYATAVSQAMTEYDSKLAKILDLPNNMLGLHYISALKEYNSTIIPLPVKRTGCDHNDTTLSGKEFSSATAIRNAVFSNMQLDCLHSSAPPDIMDALLSNTHRFPDKSKYDAIATHILRTINPEKATTLQSVSEGLHNKLLKNATTYNTVEQIITATKSKRYTYARISRIILEAVLGITKDYVISALNAPPYYRILAFSNKKTLGLIPQPLIVQNSDFGNLSHPALNTDKTACALYTNLTGCNKGAFFSNSNLSR